ncbi:MAG TPA: choice-of-anchor tandem repeat GloVer-containing protein [Candidatus Cybelea sp.]|nr:choice-of-anchor tandem repeat GloVer-containing protein [Candidatus Cybelea sp.]
MIRSVFRYATSICAIAAMLAGCGIRDGNSPVPGAMSLAATATTSSFKVLYTFKGGSGDGESPSGGLVNVNGTLYGTAVGAGSAGKGVIFSVTPNGAEKILHAFQGDSGAKPEAGLIDVDGKLYGTTYGGGHTSCGCGTVYRITTSGAYGVIHNFAGGSDGARPEGGLVDVNGTLYGTTNLGGGGTCTLEGDEEGCGTIYSVTTNGTEKIIGTFADETAGEFPTAGLIAVHGSLYGTTSEGGVDAQGTLFRITTAGVKKVLHNFGAGSDGRGPQAALLSVKNILYGTTRGGGSLSERKGTVFSMGLKGGENVLHSFSGPPDGSLPQAPLIDVDGLLYGTTPLGGAGSSNLGTVFSITTTGTENVLHSFTGGPGGSYPSSGLIDLNGTLYGTTAGDGSANHGTVYTLTP